MVQYLYLISHYDNLRQFIKPKLTYFLIYVISIKELWDSHKPITFLSLRYNLCINMKKKWSCYVSSNIATPETAEHCEFHTTDPKTCTIQNRTESKATEILWRCHCTRYSTKSPFLVSCFETDVKQVLFHSPADMPVWWKKKSKTAAVVKNIFCHICDIALYM